MHHHQPREKQIQVKKYSGNVITPNLDDASLHSLQEAQALHRQHGQQFSQSVLVRRAVRFYATHLKRGLDYDQEIIEVKRAAKGVI